MSSAINMQPMMPNRYGNGTVLTVWCVKCSAHTSSLEVWCDLDGKPGDYYCPACAKEMKS